MAEAQASLTRFPRALALGLLGLAALYAVAEALGPRGFALRDESISLFLAQRWRLGAPLETDIGGGTLLNALQGWLLQLSGCWQALHLPVLAAWLLEAWTIAQVARRLGGPRAAQGAWFAAWLGAASLLQARSLLHFALLPAFLAAALALSFGPLWCGFLAGVLCACGLLEYEAILFALPGLAAFTLFEPRLKRAQRWAPWVGFAIAAPCALWLARASLSGWWAYRTANNGPAGGQSWGRALVEWAFGGEPAAYLGVWHHASFAAWALPLAAWGLWSQARRRPWLWVWLGSGFLTLLAAAGPLEPQRAIAAWPALVVATGFGWREAWVRARRHRSAALLLIALPVLGFAWEVRAFEASMAHGRADYARSLAWIQYHHDPGAPVVDGSLMPAGLSFEATRPGKGRGVPSRVWVPVELAAELGDSPWKAESLGQAGSPSAPDLLVQVPADDPLWEDLRQLRPVWVRTPVRDRLAYARALRAVLPRLKTPLARAAVLRHLLEQVAPLGLLNADDLKALYAAKLRSPWVFNYALEFAPRYDQRLTWHLSWLKRRAGGDAALSPFELQVLAADYARLPAKEGAPAWPAPPQP